MQRLDSAVKDFGKAGDFGDVAYWQPGLGEGLAGASGGNQLDAARHQPARQIEQAGFVADAEQGAADDAKGHRLKSPESVYRWPVRMRIREELRCISSQLL